LLLKKKIDVGCGVIHDKGKILISQRELHVHMGGYWEFPGGKKEDRESLYQCLVREIDEELGVKVEPTKTICLVEHEDTDRLLMLHFILCRFVSGSPQAKECMNFQWVEVEELREYKFPPADDELISELIEKKEEFFGEN
jgi:mutator protein MutT